MFYTFYNLESYESHFKGIVRARRYLKRSIEKKNRERAELLKEKKKKKEDEKNKNVR